MTPSGDIRLRERRRRALARAQRDINDAVAHAYEQGYAHAWVDVQGAVLAGDFKRLLIDVLAALEREDGVTPLCERVRAARPSGESDCAWS
jgi:hypothetical protein